MQNVIDKIEWMFAGLGGFLGWFFGGFDGFLYALVVFVVCDYFTGVLAAAIKHELSSEVGFKGIAKKVCIFVLVGIANIIDTQILQNGAAIRTAVVFFYLANEGLSCLENAAVIGLPVPDKLKEMKASLSGNSWANSSWDGKSVYTKKTQEQNADGSMVTITADFRKYACVEDSIADHAAYLLGAMNGSKKRYEGLAGCTDYKKAAQIIKDGGYATSHTYVQNLCNIIERWNLTQYNATTSGTTISGWYRVRKSWQNAASQKGAFHDLAYAKQCADQNPGYFVFDPDGKAVYPVTQTASVPYAVRVSINDLNIRKGPGTNYAKTGYYTGKGVFTIVAESAGAGSTKGWGKLKSGAGWISLDYAARI